MTSSTLPPQAYTREILTEAYSWLQTQPESIRKLASSPDALVGLFLRAKRGGGMTLEKMAPVSTESFRTNLKSLASELAQFGVSRSESESPPEDFAMPSDPIDTSIVTQRHETKTTSEIHTRTLQNEKSMAIDNRTIASLRRVKERFNLSSESEALRLLVVLGIERLDSFFKE